MAKPLLRTKLCDLFDIEYPIVLAGMGDVIRDYTVSTGKLCAAVSNAGGLGMIGGGTMSAAQLRHEIRDAKSQTRKPFGVDLIFPAGPPVEGTVSEIQAKLPADLTSFIDVWYEQYQVPHEKGPEVKIFDEDLAMQQWKVVVDEGIKTIALGLGTPDWIIPEAHGRGMKVMCLVGNVRQASRLAAMGADLVIAQGHEAGGHTGRIGLMSLLPAIIAAVSPVPVLAAGGIVIGSQLAAALAMGAVGVWVGTAFEATSESPITDLGKQKLVEADEESARISKIYTGKTARTLRNPFTDSWDKAGIRTLPMPYQNYLVRDFFYSLERNRPELIFVGSGQGVGLIKKIRSAQEVVDDFVQDAIDILKKRLPAEVTI
ncbi:MAG: nitronate monooxygenase family protein [Dehalococcoidia bacterium]|jgi:NAD(P)H-dependent flavin oxidoreductase YrpB (nitropropane dioxygenase family)